MSNVGFESTTLIKLEETYVISSKRSWMKLLVFFSRITKKNYHSFKLIECIINIVKNINNEFVNKRTTSKYATTKYINNMIKLK